MGYSFFYHYNKPASKKAGHPVITVHYRGSCLLVKNIECNVKTKGKINKRQPYFVITGKADSVLVKDEIAYID